MAERLPVHRPHGTDRREYDRAYNRRRRSDGRAAVEKLRSSGRWAKVRALKFAANPLCERCERDGVTRAATQVHHRVAANERPDLFFEWKNLESVCDPCHAKANAAERARGGGPGAPPPAAGTGT